MQDTYWISSKDDTAYSNLLTLFLPSVYLSALPLIYDRHVYSPYSTAGDPITPAPPGNDLSLSGASGILVLPHTLSALHSFVGFTISLYLASPRQGYARIEARHRNLKAGNAHVRIIT